MIYHLVIETIERIKVDILILVYFTINVIYSYKLNDGILSEKKESLNILYFFLLFFIIISSSKVDIDLIIKRFSPSVLFFKHLLKGDYLKFLALKY